MSPTTGPRRGANHFKRSTSLFNVAIPLALFTSQVCSSYLSLLVAKDVKYSVSCSVFLWICRIRLVLTGMDWYHGHTHPQHTVAGSIWGTKFLALALKAMCSSDVTTKGSRYCLVVAIICFSYYMHCTYEIWGHLVFAPFGRIGVFKWSIVPSLSILLPYLHALRSSKVGLSAPTTVFHWIHSRQHIVMSCKRSSRPQHLDRNHGATTKIWHGKFLVFRTPQKNMLRCSWNLGHKCGGILGAILFLRGPKWAKPTQHRKKINLKI